MNIAGYEIPVRLIEGLENEDGTFGIMMLSPGVIQVGDPKLIGNTLYLKFRVQPKRFASVINLTLSAFNGLERMTETPCIEQIPESPMD